MESPVVDAFTAIGFVPKGEDEAGAKTALSEGGPPCLPGPGDAALDAIGGKTHDKNRPRQAEVWD
jgi:hypothetical protein